MAGLPEQIRYRSRISRKISNFCGAGQELAGESLDGQAILPAHRSRGFRKNLKGVMRTGPRVVSILGLSRGPKHPTQRRGAAELAFSCRGRVSGRQQPASPENSGNVSGVSAVNAEDPGADARPGTLLASPRRDRRRAPGPCMRFPPTSHSRGQATFGRRLKSRLARKWAAKAAWSDRW
jgi:hypothetical protein